MDIMTLADFSSSIIIIFNSDPVSVCVLLYGIILIQILIMLKISLLHAPDYMILTTKIEKSPYRGRADTPLPHPSPARSLRSLAFVLKIFSVFFLKSPPPPHFGRPVYATDV